VQEAPAATLEPQVLPVNENAVGLVPEKVVPVMVKAEVPVLVSAVEWAAVWLIFMEPKSRLAGAISTEPFVTVTVALFVFVVSVTEVAVTVTVAGLGSAAGAV
jgi:hypothetical protein